MLNEVVDRARKGVSAKDRDERAQAAVRAFRQMQFGLSSYARAITGNPHVRVEVDGGIPRTDGTVIYYRPPIELGDKTPHDRYYCDERDDYGLQVCPACRVREEVLVNIYHEIAHIAFSTFADTSDSDRRKALDEAIREWGGDFEKRIRERFESAPLNVRMSYMGLANLVSPYLPFLFNSLEDARVDSAMFKVRKGTRKMLEADTLNLLRQGVPNADGELQRLADSPLNSQAALGCYLYVTGYKGWRDLVNEKVVADLADPELISYLDEIKTADNVSDVFGITFPVLARLRELGYLKTPEEEQDEEQQEESDDSSDSGPESEAPSEGSDSNDGGGGDGAPPEDGPAAAPSRGDEAEADSGSADPEAAGEEAEQVPPVEDGHGGDAGAEDEPSGSKAGAGADRGGATEGEEGGESDGDDHAAGEAPDDGSVPDGGGQLPSKDEGGDQGVPEQPEDGLGDASDSESSDAEGDGGASDPSEQDGSGGGDQEPDEGAPESEGAAGSGDQGDLDAGDGGSSDAVTGQSEPDSGPELDGDRGDEGVNEGASDPDGSGADGQGAHSEGDPAPQADSSAGEGGTAEDSPEPDSVRDEGGADGPSGEADRPDGPVDSGADQGLGGIKTENLPDYGGVEDVEAALDHGHETHSHDDNNPEAVADVKAILTAIVQGMYFETPSVGVKQVQEHYFGPYSYGWVNPYGERYAKAFGVEADTDVPESVLGPALLKTRRIFSDNKKAQHTSNLRSGRVNQRVLGKRAFSGDDRLFKKKRQPAKKSYAVLIGMDISSSNKGDNMARLKRAVMAQAELCQRVGVEFAIVAHSCAAGEGGFAMHIHHVKDWNQPWDDKAKAALDGLVSVGGNLDGHALEFMRKGIMYHTATEKIIMYYTDGKMPAANHNEELEVLVQQIKHCKRDNITLMGVGMQTDSPVRHGLDTVQVNSDEDLKSVVEHLGKRLAVRAR